MLIKHDEEDLTLELRFEFSIEYCCQVAAAVVVVGGDQADNSDASSDAALLCRRIVNVAFPENSVTSHPPLLCRNLKILSIRLFVWSN